MLNDSRWRTYGTADYQSESMIKVIGLYGGLLEQELWFMIDHTWIVGTLMTIQPPSRECMRMDLGDVIFVI
jgi:hypothetical protein